MEDRRCWKLLMAVRNPPRGHIKTAKAMATRYGEAQPMREGGREGGGRCERGRAQLARVGAMARPQDL